MRRPGWQGDNVCLKGATWDSRKQNNNYHLIELFFFLISWRLITLQYCSGFCHTLTWISHGFTCIPHPDPPSHLPLHPHWAIFTLTHLKRPWCWERLRAGGEGDDRGWDSWVASPTQWTWVWVSSGSCWWTGRPGVLQSTGLQRVGHDWATELKESRITQLVRCQAR